MPTALITRISHESLGRLYIRDGEEVGDGSDDPVDQGVDRIRRQSESWEHTTIGYVAWLN